MLTLTPLRIVIAQLFMVLMVLIGATFLSPLISNNILVPTISGLIFLIAGIGSVFVWDVNHAGYRDWSKILVYFAALLLIDVVGILLLMVFAVPTLF